MKKYSIIASFILFAILFFLKGNNIDFVKTTEKDIQINEEIVYKKYEVHSKKSINDISIDDINNVKISANKFKEILKYKSYLGAIQKVDDLLVITRMNKEDIDKLKEIYEDEKNNVIYNTTNINTASKKELQYIGFNKKSIEKIKKVKNISNVIELQELVGDDYKNIKSIISFE